MQNHEEQEGRATEPVPTTEDIAHPASRTGDRDPAVYPGEATGERHEVTQTGDAMDSQDAMETRSAMDSGEDMDTGEERDTGDATEETFADRPARDAAPGRGSEDEEEPLLDAAEAERYRTTWSEIQGRFVDDPQEAVRAADTLVAEVMQTFAGTLSEHRSGLEKQWDRGEQVATEDLRQALRAYRSLINRLLDT
ncbi:hypothetical protein ACFWBF_29380 [Streptomyces sp. NPDC060028]|uniref:hypothetical protein n=1 Tax=Streptomyces sp. NPDC060028 TaxID=3347041 RepID=UPI0036CA6BE5